MDKNSIEVNSGSEAHSIVDSDSQIDNTPKYLNNSVGAKKLRSWLNKTMKINMTDGRTLTGVFLCTDRDANIILGSCSEYLPTDPNTVNEEPRMLGLVMIPGKHIISIHIDMNKFSTSNYNNDINATGDSNSTKPLETL